MGLVEVENPNKDVTLDFKMEGPIFDSAIPIPIMVDALGHVQGVIDKAYLGLTGRSRLTKEERASFFLATPDVRRSSLLAELGIVLSGLQPTLPIIGAFGPTGIWEYAKQTFEFLKLVFEAAKSDQQASYTFSAEQSVMHVNTGSQTQVFNAPVFNIAQMSVGHYQGLAQHLKVNRVTDIEFGRQSRREIGMALPDRDLFDFPTRIEEVPHRITCEIFNFNKFDNEWRLHVFADQEIPEANYKFKVIGTQDVSAYIEAMLRQAVSVTCLREISENPISKKRITRLQIINVKT